MKTENTIATKNVLAQAGLKARTNVKARAKAICSMLAIIFTLSLAIPAKAQLTPDFYDVFQIDRFGNRVKAGVIYVGPREPEATQYVEHWVLFDNYIYPSVNNPVVTMIATSRQSYANEQEFFARVAWGPGFRYVRVDCLDTTQLPGR